ncbi:MAG TPA: hypothetical protein VJA21_11060 [Verrucomicrobiae bacterium]
MSRFAHATMPGGYWAEGACCREAVLRELTGEDEVYLLEEGADWLPAQWATEALARCVVSLGKKTPATREVMRSLTVGDREALLLQLRRLNDGDWLPCVLRCPTPDCAKMMDLELKVSDLLLPPYAEQREVHVMTVDAGGDSFNVRFHLPTGSDQETAAVLAQSDLSAAEELLLRRCVEAVTGPDGAPVQEIPAVVRDKVPARMSELDSQAELTMRLVCPECGTVFTTIFDTATYVLEEIKARAHHLDREIHLLAYHYHWGPAEVLALSARRRRRHLELLADELAQERQG